MQNVNPAGVPPHELKLKEGCIVMLLRNWSVEEGLTNGTRLRVTRLRYQAGNGVQQFSHLLECKVITDNGDGPPEARHTVYVPKMTFVVTTKQS